MAVAPDGNPREILTGWWRVSLRAKGVAVLAVPMAALFAALLSIFWVEGDVGEADATVVRAYAMRGDLVDLRSSLLDTQTAVWGYLATGEKRFLTIYDASLQAIGRTLSRTAAQLSGDAKGMTSLAEIQRLTAEEVGGLGPRGPTRHPPGARGGGDPETVAQTRPAPRGPATARRTRKDGKGSLLQFPPLFGREALD